jgi:hypothetical protein
MFELSYQELISLTSQFGMSNRGGTRYMPMVFTEQSVAMLSGILNSKWAIRHLESKRAWNIHRDPVSKIDNLMASEYHDMEFYWGDPIFLVLYLPIIFLIASLWSVQVWVKGFSSHLAGFWRSCIEWHQSVCWTPARRIRRWFDS